MNKKSRQRDKLEQQMTADLLAISKLTQQPIKKMRLNTMGVFQEVIAPKTLQEQLSIQLNDAQFDKFMHTCNTQQNVPDRLKLAAQCLDKEKF